MTDVKPSGVSSVESTQSCGKSFSAHVYALVRVKVLGVQALGSTPQEMADGAANAVSANSREWMQPLRGSVRSADGTSCDVEQVEFAEGVNWVMVDELGARPEDTREHHFDHTGASMAPYPGCATAEEGRLKKENEVLRSRIALLERQLKSLPVQVGQTPEQLLIKPGVSEIDIRFPEGMRATIRNTGEVLHAEIGGLESAAPYATTSVSYAASTEAILARYAIQEGEVAEWVGLHYAKNYQVESSAQKLAWIERYIDSHGLEEASAEDAPSPRQSGN